VERSFADDKELTAWGPLYRVGAGVALAMLALVPIAVLGFLVAPPPSTVSEAFALFQRSKLLGLVSMDLIYMIEIILGGLLLLVLCVALRRVSPSFVAVALFLNIVATSIYFALVLVAWALLRLGRPPGRKTAQAAAPPELARNLAPQQ
jgi:hypothetical protein